MDTKWEKMKCKICGKNCEKEYCFQHKPRKKLKCKVITKEEFMEINTKISKMKFFFRDIWNKRKHYSEISNTWLGPEPLTIFFHHILEKEKYEQVALDEENIILLTFDEHTNVGNDIYRYPEINKRREYLKTKYNL